MKRILRYWKWFLALILIFCGILIYANISVVNASRQYIFENKADVPACEAAMVLGAKVNKNGTLPAMTLDRARASIDLYRASKVRKILISGDHGHAGYDE